ncbi:hypothetical protein DFR67_114148 [Williamsia limnetica]|uniref:SMODS and SLOG-associating 2TM effector domain-containing protein n=2 Tax=Williamsia limnetica TaxID=882452 RepID=A0A318RF69_WILLI|nr:hypothetical protein DFR67_114148 [Williamsia limnetica]
MPQYADRILLYRYQRAVNLRADLKAAVREFRLVRLAHIIATSAIVLGVSVTMTFVFYLIIEGGSPGTTTSPLYLSAPIAISFISVVYSARLARTSREQEMKVDEYRRLIAENDELTKLVLKRSPYWTNDELFGHEL